MADFEMLPEGGDEDGGALLMSLGFTMLPGGGDEDGGEVVMTFTSFFLMIPVGGDKDGGTAPMVFTAAPPPPAPPRRLFTFFNGQSIPFQELRFMQPTTYLYNRLAAAIAADALSLDDDTNLAIGLIKSDFTPSMGIVLGDFTEADFNTYARKTCTPPAVVFSDPATGEKLIRAAPPVGVLAWSTGSTANLPQTIFGFFMFATDNAELLGTEKFANPIILTAAGQLVEVDEAMFRLRLSAMV